MARTAPFDTHDTHHQHYDAWFERHAAAMPAEAYRVLKPGGTQVLGVIETQASSARQASSGSIPYSR